MTSPNSYDSELPLFTPTEEEAVSSVREASEEVHHKQSYKDDDLDRISWEKALQNPDARRITQQGVARARASMAAAKVDRQ